MNREIKFRVFDKVNNEMCEWYELVNNPTLLRDCLSASDSTRVDIMQFTGLKDKHGKEIYEGDIVQDYAGFKGAISYSEDSASYIVTFNEKSGGLRKSFMEINSEIIGNIHSNPELIK